MLLAPCPFQLFSHFSPLTSHLKFLLQISIPIEAGAVVGEELLAFLERDLALLDTLGHPYIQLAQQLLGVLLHIFEHLLHRLAVDDLVDMVVVVFHRDVYGIGVAEEVVHITQDFLIGTHKEYP